MGAIGYITSGEARGNVTGYVLTDRLLLPTHVSHKTRKDGNETCIRTNHHWVMLLCSLDSGRYHDEPVQATLLGLKLCV